MPFLRKFIQECGATVPGAAVLQCNRAGRKINANVDIFMGLSSLV